MNSSCFSSGSSMKIFAICSLLIFFTFLSKFENGVIPMEPDKISLKILKKLYKSPISEKEYKAVLGWIEKDQFNDVDSFLRKNNLVKYVIIDGIKDGAGGYIDDTVVRRYEITRNGRAEVERLAQDRRNLLLRLLDTLLSFLPLH